MKTLSIAIPTYEMHGHGSRFLSESFERLERQTFTDFDVIISDHSIDDAIEALCKNWQNRLDITYVRNTNLRGNSSANANNAIRHATGKIIKVLFQDDFLYHDRALENIVSAFDLERDHWLVNACIHTENGTDFYRPFYPHYNALMHLGKNTISSPSVLAIKNERPLLFNESLIWLMDCDYYRRCYDAFGLPKILDSITVVNRIGSHQVTHSRVTEDLKYGEFLRVFRAYPRTVGTYIYFILRTIRHLLTKAGI